MGSITEQAWPHHMLRLATDLGFRDPQAEVSTEVTDVLTRFPAVGTSRARRRAQRGTRAPRVRRIPHYERQGSHSGRQRPEHKPRATGGRGSVCPPSTGLATQLWPATIASPFHKAYARSQRRRGLARHARTTHDDEGANFMPLCGGGARIPPECLTPVAPRGMIGHERC
jgi:hypothetical protein